jgi:hypothetical protein
MGANKSKPSAAAPVAAVPPPSPPSPRFGWLRPWKRARHNVSSEDGVGGDEDGDGGRVDVGGTGGGAGAGAGASHDQCLLLVRPGRRRSPLLATS